MYTVSLRIPPAGCGETYFAYLSRSGRMPNTIRTLIDRYHITVYDNATTLDLVIPRFDLDTNDQASMTSLNFSTNNNDVDPVQSPPQVPPSAAQGSPSPTKVVKKKFPSLTRRLSKFGKRSSTDKNKADVECTSVRTSPSDSQLTETASSAETSITTVDDPNLQSPETCVVDEQKQKMNDQNELKKYEEESAAVSAWTKSSTEEVPLRAKPAINFQDAIFYYPAESADDDDDNRRGLAHALSEGRVPATSPTACCSSDDRLPVKEAYSMQPAVGDDMLLISGSSASRRRPPSMLRRMRAFFGRSSSTSTDMPDEIPRVGRQLSAADATTGWAELDDPPSVPKTEYPGAASLGRRYTSPPAGYFDGGVWKTERGSSVTMVKVTTTLQGTDNILMAEAAAGEQPRDIKDIDEQLTACSLAVPDSDAMPY